MTLDATPAVLTDLPDGRQDIEICEVGRFSVPQALLASSVLLPSSLDMVTVSVGTGGTFTLEAVGGRVTTEMLTETIRLRVVPKVGFDALDALVAWADHDPELVPGPPPPHAAQATGNLYDFLAERLAITLEEVFRGGWILNVETTCVVLDDVRGDLDVLATYDRVYAQQDLRFEQTVLSANHDAAANRVLKSAVLAVLGAGERLAPALLTRVRHLAAAMPGINAYRSAGEALAEVERLLGYRLIAGVRGYYYPALCAAQQVLRGARRSEGVDALIEDAPLRIDMPDMFERAVRNAAGRMLRGGFQVSKEAALRMYQPGAPTEFDPLLEPDLVIRPLGAVHRCAAIVDAKYKERPAASDHYQLAAYAEAYGAPLAGFVSVTGQQHEEGLRHDAQSRRGVTVFEYSIYAGEIDRSLRTFGRWLRERLAT